MAEKLSWYFANFYHRVKKECRQSTCDDCRIGNILCNGATSEKHPLEYQENVEKLMQALDMPDEIVFTKADLTNLEASAVEKRKFTGEKKISTFAERLDIGDIFEYKGDNYVRTLSIQSGLLTAINLRTSCEALFDPTVVVQVLLRNSLLKDIEML